MTAADFTGLKSPVETSYVSAHGGARDDEQDQCSIQVPILGTPTTTTNVGSQHGQPSLYTDDVNGDNVSVLERTMHSKSKQLHTTTSSHDFSFYGRTHAGELLGQEPRVPRYFLSYAYCQNSFFARRLLRVSCALALVMLGGMIVYYTYRPASLVLNKSSPDHVGFMLQNPSLVYTFQASPCENMVGFSALVYHAFPAVIFLGLPGTGLRVFEPFKREPHVDALGNRNKIKRTLVFQACEMVGVLMLVFALVVMLYFWYMFFNGGTFECPHVRVHIFSYGALVCYLCIFVELAYFARFREHIKMQLGAFKESDQTGNVRKQMIDPATSELMTKDDQLITLIRNRLYKATRLNDLREMRLVLELAKTKKLDQKGFPHKFYANAKIYFRLFGHSKKNPMHVAAYNGNLDALELLLSYGFDVGALDKFTRVRFSTGDLFWYFAQFFISKPVTSDEENAVSIFKTTLVTPLHCAVATGQVDAVRWLIERGADVCTIARSSYRSERIPPIFLAETPSVVRVLLENGANHLAVPDPGYMNTVTALQLAYLRGNLAVAQELEEWGSDVALTPFHVAAAMNDTARVRQYIRRHTDINCLGEHGYYGMNRRTPLHWAVVNGATETVELLLEAGADANFQDARGRSALHWAARLHRVEIVKCLLRKGALPNVPDIDHMTPIVCAAHSRFATRDVFAALVGAGADINYQMPSTGDTAFHIAVREENAQAALAILACGGNIMKMNLLGLRPLDCSTNTKLLFEIKRAAGQRDVMISYTHSHSEFAKKLRKSLEDANITTWLDLMDPSGIGGGSVWREEIARGISSAALVVAILTEDYAQSEWCLKELALAKQLGTPILAVSTEGVRIGEELQVYLYTRQIIPFEPAITETKRNAENSRQIEYDYDETKYRNQFRMLLDGVRDEVEKRRNATIAKNSTRGASALTTDASIVSVGFSKVFQPWESPTGPQQFVFISHGDRHSTFVSRLCQELHSREIAFYGDRNVEGQSFDERIHLAKEAILQCSCFVVLLSKDTMNNELVRDQLAFAEDKGRPIFPVVLNDVEVGYDKRYSLARSEFFHFLLDGFGFQSSMNQLAVGLRRHCPAKPSISNSTTASSFVGHTNASFVSNNSFVSFVHTNPQSAHGGAATGSFLSADGSWDGSDGPTYSSVPPSYVVPNRRPPPPVPQHTAIILEDDERVIEAVRLTSDSLVDNSTINEVRNLESISSIDSEDRAHLDLVRM